jgi:hypothetical protein
MTTGATGQLGLALPVQGELSGTWGDTVNNGLTQYINIAIAGTLTLTGDGAVTLANTTGDASASNVTSTLTGAGTVTAQFAIVKVTGTLTVAKVVTGPSYSKTYTVVNSATGGIVTFKASGQTGVSVAVGETAFVYFNGTDYVKVAGTVAVASFQTSLSGLTPSTATTGAVTLAGTLGVASGGTGLTAGTSGGILGYTATGTLASSVALTANALVLGAGAGATPTPMASLGTTTTVLHGNASGAPTFGAVSLTADVTGVLPTANGGTNLGGATPFTSGGVVYASSSSALATGSALTWDTTNFNIVPNAAGSYTNTINLSGSSSNGTKGHIGQFADALYLTSNFYYSSGQFVDTATYGSAGIFLTSGTTTTSYIGFGITAAGGSGLSEQMRLTSSLLYTASGVNVAIGASSASSKLDVVRSSTATGAFDEPVMRAINSGAATLNQRVDIAMRWQDGTYNGIGGISMVRESATARSGSLVFLPIDSGGNGLAAMQLNSAGNLGLGVPPSAWSLGKAFEVGTVGNAVWGASSADVRILAGTYYNSGFLYAVSSLPVAKYEISGGAHAWFNAASGTAGTAVSFTQAMTLDASGNLVVGATSANAKFDVSVVGTASYSPSSAPTATVLVSTSGAANSRYTSIGINCRGTSGQSQTNYITSVPEATDGNAALAFSVYGGYAAVERARIDSSGRFMIGTQTPLDIATVVMNGSSNANGITVRAVNSGGAGSQPGIVFASSAGAIAGQVFADVGGSSLYLNNGSGGSTIFLRNNTESARFDTAGNFLLGRNVSIAKFNVGSVGGTSYPTYSSPVAGGFDGGFQAAMTNSADNYLTLLDIGSVTAGTDGTNGGSAIRFLTQPRVSPYALIERARIDSSGNLLVGTTTAGAGLGYATRIAVDGGDSEASVFKTSAGISAHCSRMWNSATSGDNCFIAFQTEAGGTQRGSITYNRTAGLTAYNTTSDYRAKDISGPVTNSGALIDSTPVYMGKMKGATQERPMFIAHETPAYAHTGEKDAVDKDGNPKYQQMDASALIPVMWAEIQSLRKRLADAGI